MQSIIGISKELDSPGLLADGQWPQQGEGGCCLTHPGSQPGKAFGKRFHINCLITSAPLLRRQTTQPNLFALVITCKAVSPRQLCASTAHPRSKSPSKRGFSVAQCAGVPPARSSLMLRCAGNCPSRVFTAPGFALQIGLAQPSWLASVFRSAPAQRSAFTSSGLSAVHARCSAACCDITSKCKFKRH